MTKALEETKKKEELQPANDRVKTIRDLLDVRKHEIRLAAPKLLNTERLMRVCLSTIQKNPRLLECTQASLLRVVMDAATFGLIPDGATNEAHMVPFFNSKKNQYEAQFMVGYRGLIKLALNSGYVHGVEVHEVYENDEFRYNYGLNPDCHHIEAEKDRGGIRAFYCVVIQNNGHRTFQVMFKAAVDEHRDRFCKSKDKKGNIYGPWVDHYTSMGLKTVLKRGLKYCPLSSELAQALNLDDMQEAGLDDGNVIDIPKANGNDSKPKTGTEGFEAAIEEASESEEQEEQDVPIGDPRADDLRTVISDTLMAEFPKNKKNRNDKLMAWVLQVSPKTNLEAINGVDDLSEELARQVYALC